MAACADSGAIERGGGAGELELAGQRPALQQSIDKTSVEDVSGAGGVRGLDAKRRGVVKLCTVVGEYAFVAESGGGESRVVSGADERERFAEVGFAGEAGGNVAAGDEVVDQREKGIDAGVEFVEIGDDGNACFSRPRCGDRSGGGVVAVEMERAGFENPFALQIGGLDSEAVVALPEDGTLAGVVDQDEGLLAGAAGCGEEVCFDAEVGELGAVQSGGKVVANFADVASAQSPGLAGDHGGGDLSAGEDVGGAEFDFRAGGREVLDGNERVGGIEADTDDVDFGNGRHLAGPNVKEVQSDAKRNAVATSFRLPD